jgi:hypothetical protein
MPVAHSILPATTGSLFRALCGNKPGLWLRGAMRRRGNVGQGAYILPDKGAEAGCSLRELMPVSGHETQKEGALH